MYILDYRLSTTFTGSGIPPAFEDRFSGTRRSSSRRSKIELRRLSYSFNQLMIEMTSSEIPRFMLNPCAYFSAKSIAISLMFATRC